MNKEENLQKPKVEISWQSTFKSMYSTVQYSTNPNPFTKKSAQKIRKNHLIL